MDVLGRPNEACFLYQGPVCRADWGATHPLPATTPGGAAAAVRPPRRPPRNQGVPRALREWLRRRRQQQRLLQEVVALGIKDERRRAARLQADIAEAARAAAGGGGGGSKGSLEGRVLGDAAGPVPRRGAAARLRGAGGREDGGPESPGGGGAPEAALRAELQAARARLSALTQTAVRWRQSEELYMEQLRAQRARWRAAPGAAAAARAVTPQLVAALFERAAAGLGGLAPTRLALLLWSAPWLGFCPPPGWAAAAASALGRAACRMTMRDACLALWGAARLQQDLRLPPEAGEALLGRTRELLLAAAAAARVGAGAARPAAQAYPGSPGDARRADAGASTCSAAPPLQQQARRGPLERPAWPPAAGALHALPGSPLAPGPRGGAAPGFRYHLSALEAACSARHAGQPGGAFGSAAAPRAALSRQDAVVLPWAVSELGLRPGSAWTAAFAAAARPLLPRMTGLQVGVMLRSLALARAPVPDAFLEAADTLYLVNSATWAPNECALVGASILQLRQVAAEAARPPRGARGAARGGAEAAAAAAEAEWELLFSLGAAPASVLVLPSSPRRGAATGGR
jgi:hypothetical protein